MEKNVSQELINFGSSKQLLIDDAFVARTENIRRVVNTPVKTGEKLIVADKPWESFMVGPYCTIMDDAGTYKCWYESYTRDDSGKRIGFLCYAQSTDGLRWEKPELGILEWKGSKKNNIVMPVAGIEYHGGGVFKDTVAGGSERYKIIFMGPKEKVYGGYSADGLNWHIYEKPLLHTQSDTQSVAFWDERLQKYVCYVRLNPPIRDPNVLRHIGRSETDDFRVWPAADIVLGCDEQDGPEKDLYTSAAFRYPYAADAYFVMTSVFDHKSDTLEAQLAVSRDGIRWERPDRRTFIPRGATGDFDSVMIHTVLGHIRKGSELWIYYRGTDKYHTQHRNEVEWGGVLSRAVLRLDGFVSLDAKEKGLIVTRPFMFSGQRLEINCDAQTGGYVAVELCDCSGTPLQGYSFEQCSEITGDNICAAVKWNNSPDLSRLKGTPIVMKIRLKQAKLFAFEFANAGRHEGDKR